MTEGNTGERETVVERNEYRHPLKKSRKSIAAKHAVIIDLKLKGNEPSAIADVVNMPVESVRTVLKRFKPVFKELEGVSDYREGKSDLLAAGQIAALKSAFSESKLKKASFLSLITGFEKLNQAERLENNQSTANISVQFGKKQLLDEK